MIKFLITGLILTWFLPVIGYFIFCINKLFYKLCSCILGEYVSFLFFNYITFIGVIHHELSHMLFALFTGAKIYKVELFRPTKDSLGSVIVGYRGSKLKQSIQATFVSVAPIVVGVLSVFSLYKLFLFLDLSIIYNVIFIYVMLSIVLHMTMSKADFSNYVKGSFVLTLLITILCYAFGFSLI